MHLGVKCIPFGAAFHLGFGQCPAVGDRGVKWSTWTSFLTFLFLYLFFFLPLLQEFTFILMISLVHFTFHVFYLETPMPRSRLSSFPQTSTRQSGFKSDHVFLKSWTESPNTLLGTGLIQMASPRFSPSSLCPLWFISEQQREERKTEKENKGTWNHTIHNPTMNQVVCLQRFRSYAGSL